MEATEWEPPPPPPPPPPPLLGGGAETCRRVGGAGAWDVSSVGITKVEKSGAGIKVGKGAKSRLTSVGGGAVCGVAGLSMVNLLQPTSVDARAPTAMKALVAVKEPEPALRRLGLAIFTPLPDFSSQTCPECISRQSSSCSCSPPSCSPPPPPPPPPPLLLLTDEAPL